MFVVSKVSCCLFAALHSVPLSSVLQTLASAFTASAGERIRSFRSIPSVGSISGQYFKAPARRSTAKPVRNLTNPPKESAYEWAQCETMRVETVRELEDHGFEASWKMEQVEVSTTLIDGYGNYVDAVHGPRQVLTVTLPAAPGLPRCSE